MQVIADLQLHSRFSRAVSPQMTLPNISTWAKRKGIGLVATGDWTHPIWFSEIERDLEELGNGLLRLKSDPNGPLFLLATEVSCIYSQDGKLRRVHTLIWVPTTGSARQISQEMTKRGCNLLSDGRPIIGLTSIQVAELVLGIEPEALIIPAHAWTPWFSVFGSMSGFDSLDQAFGPYAKQIYAVETGLSSNPAMNWQISELDNRAIVSFSDAHSGPKLGREATVFEVEDGTISYKTIYESIRGNTDIAYTIEFYPEEGKYHYTGHRACNIRLTPEEEKQKGSVCPVCGKPLTQGVAKRVGELAGRPEDDLQLAKNEAGMTYSRTYPKRSPFVMLVPLLEIVAESLEKPVTSPAVQSLYMKMTDELGSEFAILLDKGREDIVHIAGERVAAGIMKVRKGELHIDPGYDGVFGVVKLWQEGEEKPLVDASREQLGLFGH
jgi:uncharacterized protein (TIGR00375 family)